MSSSEVSHQASGENIAGVGISATAEHQAAGSRPAELCSEPGCDEPCHLQQSQCFEHMDLSIIRNCARSSCTQLPAANRQLCAMHLQERAESQARCREERRALGLCSLVRCDQPRAVNRPYCTKHIQEQQENRARRCEKRLRSGLCKDCDQPRADNRAMCIKHILLTNEYGSRRLRAKKVGSGLCLMPWCRRPAVPNSKKCGGHCAMDAEAQKANLAGQEGKFTCQARGCEKPTALDCLFCENHSREQTQADAAAGAAITPPTAAAPLESLATHARDESPRRGFRICDLLN
jgi:hypothetical protein